MGGDLFKEYETAKFSINRIVTWATGITYISLRQWNKLDEKQKQLLISAGEQSTELAAKFWKENNEESLKQLKAKGVEFFDLSPEMQAKWAMLVEKGGREGALKLSPKYADEMINIFKKYTK